ncbi:hypothetical protein DPMN_039043 [Dreissena polymorpha]|uniref:Uncharacterized protein n=1 Tax=Dreissena polymorpha TaxID=45954 RepID=A0A9D4MGH2_DREPO|nr:hypothetical protein DPMN_039043 [Dreissena polymorpha]
MEQCITDHSETPAVLDRDEPTVLMRTASATSSVRRHCRRVVKRVQPIRNSNLVS